MNIKHLGMGLMLAALTCAAAPAMADEAPTFPELVTSSLPELNTPERPTSFTIAEVPNGVANFSINVISGSEMAVNADCTAPITLTREGDTTPVKSVSASDTPALASTNGKYVMVNQSNKRNIIICFNFEGFSIVPITDPGNYTLSVPDGFFLKEGVEVKGGDLHYVLKGDDPIVEPTPDPVFTEMVTEYSPVPDVPFTVEQYPDGMALLTFTMDNSEMKVNPEKTEGIHLTIEELDYNGQSRVAQYAENDSFVPYVEIVENVVKMHLSDKPMTQPGTRYTVTIPDGFFLKGEAEVKGCTLTYIIQHEVTPQPDPEPVEFADMVISCSPPVDKKFKPVEDYSAGVGFLKIIAKGQVQVNTGCVQKITLTKAGEETPMFSIKSTDSPMKGSESYVDISAKEDNTQVQIIFSWDPVAADGHYVVSIPEGFFYQDGVEVLGTELNFYINVTPGEDPTPDPDPLHVDSIGTDGGQQLIFRLDGTRALKADKGIYIINGKKVVVK